MKRIERIRGSLRRGAIAIAAFAALTGSARAGAAWAEFLKAFVSADGRVVDTGNGRVSHSEGQGYGMILAVAHDDRAAFERIWKWTREHLQIRSDALLAWKWEPRAGGRGVVTDMNNATDGDILVAWALFRAADRWKAPAWREDAREILAGILARAVVPSAFGPLLLPGAEGFSRAGGVVVNPSYWIFPAFRTFAKEDPKTDWMAVSASGRRLLGTAKFGRWGLPPEWLLVRGSKVELPEGFAPDFGYNAIRIPMHLVWDGETAAENFAGYRAYAASFPSLDEVKATVNLVTNTPGRDPLLPGMAGIYRLVGASGPAGTADPSAGASLSTEPYFSAALTLLARLAFAEGGKPAETTRKDPTDR